MNEYKRYSLQKIVNRINRKGSKVQKYALTLCENLGLFNFKVEDLVLTGAAVLDLCQWGFKEIEVVYKVDINDFSTFITTIYNIFGNKSGYKHVLYVTGDVAIQFYFGDWKIVLWVTSSIYNYRKILFAREYLIDNLAPEGREMIVSLCKSNTPLGMAIKEAVSDKYGFDHVLTRLSNFQIGDVRHDTVKPMFQLVPFSSGVAMYEWETENQTWKTLLKFPDLVHSGFVSQVGAYL